MMNLTVSPRAADELKKAVTAQNPGESANAVRVMVQGTCGCGSAHFAMGFDEVQPDDNLIELGGITLVVDPDSAPYLENAEVDYYEDTMRHGFKINAPQSGGGCGCGGHGHQH